MAFHRLRFACAAFLIGTFTAFSTVSAMANQPAPQQVVEQSYAVLLTVMKEAKTLGFDGRIQRLAPLVEKAFDLPFMAKITAGRYWAKASDDQRKHFVEAFARMTVATMASRFDGYGGEKFDVLGSEEKSPGMALVKTAIVKGDGDKVEIDYLLRNSEGGWKVADVYANGGISELAVKTADYAQVLKTGGVDALADALDKKAAGLGESAN